MKNILKIFLFFLTAFVPMKVRSQETQDPARIIDSIGNLLQKDAEDTAKMTHLNRIAEVYYRMGTYDSAIHFTNRVLDMCSRKEFPKELQSELQKQIAKADNTLGNVYRELADFPTALDLFLKALRIFETLKDTVPISKVLGNIGSVYLNQEDYTKALDYYGRSLTIKQRLLTTARNEEEKIRSKKGIAITLANMGVVYKELASRFLDRRDTVQSNYNCALALDHYFRGLKLAQEIGDKKGILSDLGNIGTIYHEKRDFVKALDYYRQAVKLSLEMHNMTSIAINFGNIGSLYTYTGKYKEAFAYIYRAIALSDSIGIKDYEKEQYQLLTSLYKNSTVPLPDTVGGKMLNMEEMRLRALYYYKRYESIRNALFSEESKKQLVRKEMNFVFEKKEAAAKAAQIKKDAIALENLKQKENERNYFIIGFAMIALLAVFVFRSYRQKQKANGLILEQKLLVEDKQKEIIDSINYARRIQQSLLPTETYISKTLKKLNGKVV